MGCDRDANCFPLAHQPAAEQRDRKKERKREREQERGSITFEYAQRYKFPAFSFPYFLVNIFITNGFYKYDEFHIIKKSALRCSA